MTRSHFERLDPENELGPLLDLTDNVVARSILGLMGAASQTVAGIADAADQMHQMRSDLQIAAEHLPPLGWIPFAQMPLDLYGQAAMLAAAGDPDAAEQHLVKGWNDGDRLRHNIQGVKRLAVMDDDAANSNVMMRWQLLNKALEHHKAGAYEASVPIVLAQTDGLVIDVTGNHKQNFFSGGEYLADEQTLAGHPDSLKVIAKLFGRGIKQTAATGELNRHAIMHGRELGYDTVRNSTKAFAALFGVIEWAVPIATDKAAVDKEQRLQANVGSDLEDSDGRRLDVREFEETRSALRWLGTCQMGRHRRDGWYDEAVLAESERRLVGIFGESHGVEIAVSEDGQTWWASRQAVTGWWFAIGANEGPPNQWLMDGPAKPSGPPGLDKRWGDSPFAFDVAPNW